MSHPSHKSAYGIWTLNDIRESLLGEVWPLDITYDPYIIQPLEDNSCVRFYPFDGDVSDLTGNDTTATSNADFVTGAVGQALQPNSSGRSEVNIEDYEGGTSGSYTFWAYLASGQSLGSLRVVLRDSNIGNNVLIVVRENGFTVRQSNGNETTAQYPFDTWVHITFIRTGASTTTVYFNGSGKEDLTGARSDNDPYILIGDNNYNDGLKLDHMRFFNKQLTAEEAEFVFLNDGGYLI